MFVLISFRIFLMVFTFAIAQSNADDIPITEEGKARVESFIDTLMQCHGTVGLSIAMVTGNSTWARGFGLADRESGRNVTTDTLFGLASITTMFTSALLSIVIDNVSRFSWNSRVADIVGSKFRLFNDYLTSHITLKDILTHRSGLASINIPIFAAFQENMTTRDLFERLRYLPVENLFRDAFSYNNVMYGLLGYIIEIIGNSTWENLMEQLILLPLEMNNTKIFGASITIMDEIVAKPYVKTGSNGEIGLTDPSVYSIGPYKASGAVASSANDMVKWVQMLLRNGQTPEGVQVLSSAHVKEMTAVHVSTPPNSRFTLSKSLFPISSFSYGYGYGWSIGMHRGYKMLWHGGSLFGYDTILALFPQLDLGIYISVNGLGDFHSENVVREVLYFVVDIFLGEEPWLNTSNACHYPTQWQNYDMPSEFLNSFPILVNDAFSEPFKFIGIYGHKLYGNVRIFDDTENHLYVQYGRIEGMLHTTADNVIAMLKLNENLTFISHYVEDIMTYAIMTFTNYNDDHDCYSILLMSAPQWSETFPLEFNRFVNYYDHMTN